jgi:maleate isomerase
MEAPELRIGVLTPHDAVGPEEELPAMARGRVVTRVVRVSRDRGHPGTGPAALRALSAATVLDDAAQALLTDPTDAVAHASTTTAYALGGEAEASMVSRLESQLSVPVVATCSSAVLALRSLGVERLSLIGAPWFDPELNELGSAYFRSQGFDVVQSRSAELSHDPARIDPAGISEWVSRHVADDADGVFIGGNGFRAAGAIEPLEAALGRPVLTSNQVLLWNVLARTGTPYAINGYGWLFASCP